MISISNVTTEFEKKRFKKRSLSSLARGIKCPIKEVKGVIEENSDIFIKDGKFIERTVSLE